VLKRSESRKARRRKKYEKLAPYSFCINFHLQYPNN
jgi:hypothetical protein